MGRSKTAAAAKAGRPVHLPPGSRPLVPLDKGVEEALERLQVAARKPGYRGPPNTGAMIEQVIAGLVGSCFPQLPDEGMAHQIGEMVLELVSLCQMNGRMDDGATLLRHMIGVLKESCGGSPKPNHGVYCQAAWLDNLSIQLTRLGQREEAERAARRGLDLNEQAFAAGVPGYEQQVGFSCVSLGEELYNRPGQEEEGERLIRRGLEILQRLVPNIQATHGAARLLGQCLIDKERPDEALDVLKKALEGAMRSGVITMDHPNICELLMTTGSAHVSRREYVEAERHYRKALAGMDRTLPKRHPSIAICLANLARALMLRSEAEGDGKTLCQAEPLLMRAGEILERAGHPMLAQVNVNLKAVRDRMREKGFAVSTPDEAGESRMCVVCRKGEDEAKLSSCALCGTVRYCSKECQRSDWKAGHKGACTRSLEVRKEALATNIHIPVS